MTGGWLMPHSRRAPRDSDPRENVYQRTAGGALVLALVEVSCGPRGSKRYPFHRPLDQRHTGSQHGRSPSHRTRLRGAVGGGKRGSLFGLLGEVKDVARIVRNESRATRKQALQSYMRVLRSVRDEKTGRERSKELHIFGLSVFYVHAESLLHMTREIYLDRQYEFTSSRAHPTVIDAGANIGLATLFFKQKYPSAHVIAFEPEPHAFAALERNVAANDLDHVTTVQKALARDAGDAEMCGWPGSLITSLQPNRHASAEHMTVETVPLSSYIGNHLDFLKLDVEGLETEILDELSAAGKLAAIERLVCE